MSQPQGTTHKGPAAAIVALLIASLAMFEGTRHFPYRDTGGILTVCDGITGPEVIKGKWYSGDECKAMQARYLDRMYARLGKCLGPQPDKHWLWIGHVAYNIGDGRFCASTMARHIKAGNYAAACKQINRWVYVAGKDCRVAKNNCRGIVTRRKHETGLCEDAL